jgi:non-specific serine/threonine protein kinase
MELPDDPIASVARALSPGAWLEEFEVGEVIGQGSTAIVYAATDRARAIPVAIAEYMPGRLAQRNHEAQVTPRTSAQADAFAKGLKAFINETRTLARCNHPSLVRIVRLWDANGTAYRAMPRYPARRLLEVRLGMNEPPDEEAVRALLDALLGALGVFHQAGGGHGKVTPSNILLLADNRPLLLAPGAAGRAIAGDRIDVLMTGADPCFAPIEQMVESADIPLRPSVDLYALAGVARYWISGQLPGPVFGAPDSPRREKLEDTVQRLRLTWPRLHYSAALLDALDSALSIYPAERPQSVAQMRARLGTAPAVAAGPAIAARAPIPSLNDAGPNAAVASNVVPSDAAPSDAAPSDAAPSDGVPSDGVPSDAIASDAVPSDAVANDAIPSWPAPGPQPAPADRVPQDFDVVMADVPDADPLGTSGLARIDGDPSARTGFARRASKPRRIARWSGAVLVLLALLLVGVFEFGQEGRFGRVLDALGVSRGTAVQDSAAVSAPAVGTAVGERDAVSPSAGSAAPAPPPIAADAASPNPMPPESTAAESPASSAAPASPTGAPIALDAGAANSVPTEPAAADAAAPPSLANPDRTMQSAAATAASTEPAAIAQPPPTLTPRSARSAPQHTARAPATPREVCGARTQFSLYRCMKTQCSQRRWASHAQCQRLRATDSVD